MNRDAAYMAFGYAKSTGKVGVYTVVPGPWRSQYDRRTLYRSQCTGTVSHRPDTGPSFIGVGHGMLHELPDQLATLRTLTKWATRINHPAEVPSVMSEAFRQLRSGEITAGGD